MTTITAPDPDVARHRAIWETVKAPCSVPGCPRQSHAHGYCQPHYHRWKRHGDPTAGGLSRNKVDMAAWIEDIEWLIQMGECAAAISSRYRMPLSAICKRLERANRHDLAQHLWRYTQPLTGTAA